MKILEILKEDVESQRISIKLSQLITDYVNRNPQIARSYAQFKLSEIPQITQYRDELLAAADAEGIARTKASLNAAAKLIDTGTVYFDPQLEARTGQPALGSFDSGRNVISVHPSQFDPSITDTTAVRSRLSLKNLPKEHRPMFITTVGSILAHEIQHGIDQLAGIDLSRVRSQTIINRINQELEKVGGDPNKLDSELRFFYDSFSADPKWSKFVGRKFNPKMPTEYTHSVYMSNPTEINARVTEALNQFSIDLANNPQVADEYRANPKRTIGKYLSLYRVSDLYPDRLADPAYRKLFNRAVKFIDREIKDPIRLKQEISTPTLRDKIISYLTGIDLTDPGEVRPTVARAAVKYGGGRVLAVSKSALSGLVKKVFSKQAANTLFKSIPFIGWGMAIYAAGSRMIKGDYTGAGLEVISGAGSFLTAIPTAAAICARDLYNECYKDLETGKMAVLEQDLAQDPQGTQQRLAELTAMITEEIQTAVDTYLKQAQKPAHPPAQQSPVDLQPNDSYTL